MRHYFSTSFFTFATALLPVILAWPQQSSVEDSYREFDFLGKIDFPCGPDVEDWIAEVGVGTPEQVFPLNIDTTIDTSYVNGVKCRSDFCLSENRFDAKKSSTIKNLHEKVTLTFQNEEEFVRGCLFQDKFQFGNLTYDDIKFIDTFNTSGIQPSNYAGAFALGFPTDVLDANKSLRKRARGASLVGRAPPSSRGRSRRGSFRRRDNTIAYTCSLDFGVDYSAISGDIAWLDLPTCDFGDTPLWKASLHSVSAGGAFEFKFDNTLASFDSSVSDIEVPSSDLEKIYKGLDATCAEGSTEYVFECCNAKDLTFSFEKFDVTIPYQSWINIKEDNNELCTARISETKATDEPTNRWHLGTTFIEQFYTIYSVKRAQTGLALLAGGSTGVRIQSK